MIEFLGRRSLYLVANEARRAVHEVRAPAEPVLEVDLLALGDGQAVRDDDDGAAGAGGHENGGR